MLTEGDGRRILRNLKDVVQVLLQSATSVSVCLLILTFVFFNGAVIGAKLFGHLCTQEYLGDARARAPGLPCCCRRRIAQHA